MTQPLSRPLEMKALQTSCLRSTCSQPASRTVLGVCDTQPPLGTRTSEFGGLAGRETEAPSSGVPRGDS